MRAAARGRGVAREWSRRLQGIEGAEWENLYCKFVEMNNQVNVRHPSGSRATTLWKMRDAKVSCDAYCDQTSATKPECKEGVREELRIAHFRSPTFALSDALLLDGKREQKLSGRFCCPSEAPCCCSDANSTFVFNVR